MSRENMGAFIDAVYAIAVTILALEIPAEIGGNFSPEFFGSMLLNYAISFLILFALWLQHRRINEQVETYGRFGLWLNGGILLLICLIPRATTFVFDYGEDVTLGQIKESILHGGWTRAEIVDVGYIGIVLVADLGLLLLMRLMDRLRAPAAFREIQRSKITITVLIILVLLVSVILPLQNRYFLLLIPLGLMFEQNLSALISAIRVRPRA